LIHFFKRSSAEVIGFTEDGHDVGDELPEEHGAWTAGSWWGGQGKARERGKRKGSAITREQL